MMYVCDHRYRRIHTLEGPVQLVCKLNHCPDPKGRELSNRVHVVLASVGVGNLGLEEFFPGEFGTLASGFDDRGGVAGGDRFRRLDQLSRDWRQLKFPADDN
jgi:hypothetical protein